MILEYIQAAMSQAVFERIQDGENRYYAEIPALKGVWATGRTLRECRSQLTEVMEGWLIVRLRKGLRIPPIGMTRLSASRTIRFGT